MTCHYDVKSTSRFSFLSCQEKGETKAFLEYNVYLLLIPDVKASIAFDNQSVRDFPWPM